jgi:hypothetical protein
MTGYAAPHRPDIAAAIARRGEIVDGGGGSGGGGGAAVNDSVYAAQRAISLSVNTWKH